MLPESLSYRIAYCLPVFRSSEADDSSFLQQMTIIDTLRSGGYDLTLFASNDLFEVFDATDGRAPRSVKRTWTKRTWFNLASKLFWRTQKLIGVPYLNVFSNLRWFDACMQCLPGHHIVQERNGLYKMGVAMACRRLNLPYILFFDADDILEHDLFRVPLSGLLRWRAEQTVRYNLETAARVICVSTSAKRRLRTRWNVPESKIVVFPNGVDVHRFRPCSASREQVRVELGINGGPLFIFVGSFFPYQDLTVLLRAFTLVLKNSPGARLLLVGAGEQFAETLRLGDDLGIAHAARLIGSRPHYEIPRLLGAADVALAPYRRFGHDQFHGSPMKVFEYMASGVPLIATDVGQISEVIRNGVNGILVPAGDAPALAAAMETLMDDRELRLRLGQAARSDAVAKHSWEHYISRLESLYEAVLREAAVNEAGV